MPRLYNHSPDDSDSSSGGGGGSYGATHPNPHELDNPFNPGQNNSFHSSSSGLTLPGGPINTDHSYNEQLYPSQFDPGSERLGMGGSGLYGFQIGESTELRTDQWQPGQNSGMPFNTSGSAPDSPPPTSTDLLDIEDSASFIRESLSLPSDADLSLESFPDPPEGVRPSLSLPHLAMLAIHNSPRKMLTLQEIYTVIENRFEWYRNNKDSKWKGSIRHTLSLKSVFQHKPRPITEPGKGQYWFLDPSQGDGYKRERRRRNRGAHRDHDDDDDYSDHDSLHSDPADYIDPNYRVESSSGVHRTSSGRRRSPYSMGSLLRSTTGPAGPSSHPRLMHAHSTPQLHPTPNQYSSAFHGSMSYHDPHSIRSGFNSPSLPHQNIPGATFEHPSFPQLPSVLPSNLYTPSFESPPSNVYRLGYSVDESVPPEPSSRNMYSSFEDADPKGFRRVRGF